MLVPSQKVWSNSYSLFELLWSGLINYMISSPHVILIVITIIYYRLESVK